MKYMLIGRIKHEKRLGEGNLDQNILQIVKILKFVNTFINIRIT